MPLNRTQLNSLIFDNQVMLPRASPGFGEVSLAVAELQGGDPSKAAVFAEAAVAKDSGLAAGWLAKAAADVFAASGAELRVERAMFCLERAFECAPDCRRDMTEFFVTNLLAHYLSLVCEGAQAHVAESRRLDAASSTASGNARSLDFTALVAGVTAFCAKRESTRIISGLTATAAYAESALHWNRAFALTKAAEDSAGRAMMHIDPAYQLLWIASLMLSAAGLSGTLLDPMVEDFVRALTVSLDKHLSVLRLKFELPLWEYFSGVSAHKSEIASTLLEAEYAKARPVSTSLEERRFLKAIRRDIDRREDPENLKKKWSAEIARFLRPLNSPHPDCAPLLECLDRILPGVRETNAYKLLVSPQTALEEGVGSQPAPPVAAPKFVLPLSGCVESLGYLGSFVLLVIGALLLAALGLTPAKGVGDPRATAFAAVVLILIGLPVFWLVRWLFRRGKALRVKETAYQAQVAEHERLVKDAELRAKAPRARLARLVSDAYQRDRWGNVNDYREARGRTIWSASAWLGERPEERIKARLFTAARTPALRDVHEAGTVSAPNADTSLPA